MEVTHIQHMECSKS